MNKSLLSVFFAVVMAIVFSACGKQVDSRPDLTNRLQDVGRLELSKMTVGKVGMISDPTYDHARTLSEKAEAIFSNMKVGTRIGVYSYDTYILAYIDLSQIRPEDVEIDEENSIARITLPPVEIMTDGREPQLHEVHSRVTGLRSSIRPEERAKLKAKMAAEVKKEVAANKQAIGEMKKAAEEKGRVWLTNLLRNSGYEATIEYRD